MGELSTKHGSEKSNLSIYEIKKLAAVGSKINCDIHVDTDNSPEFEHQWNFTSPIIMMGVKRAEQ